MTGICNLGMTIICNFSPDMPENEATFAITPGGINDAKE